jgi:hypothetical protein
MPGLCGGVYAVFAFGIFLSSFLPVLANTNGYAMGKHPPNTWVQRANPTDFTVYEYIYHPETRTNSRAALMCAEHGGDTHLVSMASEAERDFVVSMVENNNKGIWLGMRRTDAHGIPSLSGRFVQWDDGKAVTYRSWNKGKVIGNRPNFALNDVIGSQDCWFQQASVPCGPIACLSVVLLLTLTPVNSVQTLKVNQIQRRKDRRTFTSINVHFKVLTTRILQSGTMQVAS